MLFQDDRAGTGCLAYAAAAGAALGAWLLIPVALPVIVALAGLCLWRPNPWLVLITVAALASWLGVRAVNGLDDPPTGPVEGWVTLLDDPRPLGAHGTRFTVRLGAARVEGRAYGKAAARIDDALAGERVHISGVAKAANSEWHRWRHVVATVNVDTVGDRAPAAPLMAFANRVRRLLADGARSLSQDGAAMFAGMVYGDDRNQSPRLSDDFRAAGLGHLLVVSGQNVAFVLALASPLVTRLRPGVRLVALLALLCVFAVLTRLEPSVLRAVAMAAVAVGSAALGRPESGRRALAWAVAAILLVDPFLVRVLAFQLSVCATAGLLWITPALSDALRGPRPLRLAVATTAGAQIAVTPLLVATFGSVPLASLPANVIAGPACAPVMMWGLTAGLLAGVAPPWAAWLLHRPTSVLLWWIRSVAASAAQAPPAMLGAASAAVLCIGVALVLLGRRMSQPAPEPDPADSEIVFATDGPHSLGVEDQASVHAGDATERSLNRRAATTVARVRQARLMRVLGAIAVAAVLVHGWITAASPPSGWSSVAGEKLFRDGDAVILILDGAPSGERLLESMRLAGVHRLSLVVASTGGASEAYAALALMDRYDSVQIVAPPMHRVPAARTARTGDVIRVGGATLTVQSDTPNLVVAITTE